MPLNREQKKETIDYIVQESNRLNGILDKDYYKTEMRRYCMIHFKSDPGEEFASTFIEVMITAELINEENGKIGHSKSLSRLRKNNLD